MRYDFIESLTFDLVPHGHRIKRMKKRLEPFADAVLGEVVFDPRRAYWRFNLLLPDGKTVPGTITPEDGRLPLQGQGLESMVKRVAWLVEHEEAVRRRVAEK